MSASGRAGTPLIRVAGADDAAGLHELATATFALACPPGSSPEAIAAFADEHLTAERFAAYLADPAVVLLIADEFAGFVLLSTAAPTDDEVLAVLEDPSAFELSKLYVRPEAHGAGTGPALFDAAEQAARERGGTALWLSVNEENPRARAFYERRGFARRGSWTFEVGDEHHHDLILEKPLA